MAKVRGWPHQTRPTVLYLGARQLLRPSTCHQRDTGHILIIHLHLGTPHHLQTATRMGTVLRMGNRRTTQPIIQCTRDTPRCPCIPRLLGHMAPFQPCQVKRRPLSRRPVTKRRLQMMIVSWLSARRRKNVRAARMVCLSPVRSPNNAEQTRLVRRLQRWWRPRPPLRQMTLLMTTAVPWHITDPEMLVASRYLLSLQHFKNCGRLVVFPYHILIFTVVRTIVVVAMIRSDPNVRKDPRPVAILVVPCSFSVVVNPPCGCYLHVSCWAA